MAEAHTHEGSTSPASVVPATGAFHTVTLRGPNGERRLPTDIVKDELLSLPAGTWVAFSGVDLGEPVSYTADLLRRVTPLKCHWLGRASLSMLDKPELLRLARQSGCRALVFDGERIAAQYLATEAPAPTRALAELITGLRQIPAQGLLSIIRFVFGYDTDDEGIFERTVRFCLEARVGVPQFAALTSQSGGSQVVFQPALMTTEALENGLYWTRQQVYRHSAIWQRVGSVSTRTVSHLLANYAQRRLFSGGPRGFYTEAMQLLSQLSQPIHVREQASFISTLRDAVGETRKHLQGALLYIHAIRNARLQALTFKLEGVLDASGANEVLRRIHTAIQAGHHKIVLDLKGLESVSSTVITQFLEENAQALVALRDQVVFRHLRVALDAIKENLGGVLPNAELFALAPEES
jgi:hypothetical protein